MFFFVFGRCVSLPSPRTSATSTSSTRCARGETRRRGNAGSCRVREAFLSTGSFLFISDFFRFCPCFSFFVFFECFFFVLCKSAGSCRVLEGLFLPVVFVCCGFFFPFFAPLLRNVFFSTFFPRVFLYLVRALGVTG